MCPKLYGEEKKHHNRFTVNYIQKMPRPTNFARGSVEIVAIFPCVWRTFPATSPLSEWECCPPYLWFQGGGHTRLRERGRLEPIRKKKQTLWCTRYCIIPLRILLYSMCMLIRCTVFLKSALGKVEMVVGSLSGDICQ
jgi:hypothetical protein